MTSRRRKLKWMNGSRGGQRENDHVKRERRKKGEMVGEPHHPPLIFTYAYAKTSVVAKKNYLVGRYSLIKMTGNYGRRIQ